MSAEEYSDDSAWAPSPPVSRPGSDRLSRRKRAGLRETTWEQEGARRDGNLSQEQIQRLGSDGSMTSIASAMAPDTDLEGEAASPGTRAVPDFFSEAAPDPGPEPARTARQMRSTQRAARRERPYSGSDATRRSPKAQAGPGRASRRRRPGRSQSTELRISTTGDLPVRQLRSADGSERRETSLYLPRRTGTPVSEVGTPGSGRYARGSVQIMDLASTSGETVWLPHTPGPGEDTPLAGLRHGLFGSVSPWSRRGSRRRSGGAPRPDTSSKSDTSLPRHDGAEAHSASAGPAYGTLGIASPCEADLTSPVLSPSPSTPQLQPAARAPSGSRGRVRQRPESWKLGDKIGEGTFGQVFVGINADNGELMAVKVLNIPEGQSDRFRDSGPLHLRERFASDRPSESSGEEGPPGAGMESSAEGASRGAQAVRELRNEIELMKRLDHPNIVAYLGTQVDASGGKVYIFQEWMPGGSIASLLKRFGAFSERMTQSYTRQVLAGLAYLHANGIIHRDIKGANILVDDLGTVKVSDFGCSKAVRFEGNASMGGSSMKGTPFFMAPEVLARKQYGRRADVWSVGGLVLQMFTGEPPWAQLRLRSILALHFRVVDSEEVPPMPADLPALLRAFLLCCFTRNPKLRPHAGDLLSDPWIANALPARDGSASPPLPRPAAFSADRDRSHRRRRSRRASSEAKGRPTSEKLSRMRRWQSAEDEFSDQPTPRGRAQAMRGSPGSRTGVDGANPFGGRRRRSSLEMGESPRELTRSGTSSQETDLAQHDHYAAEKGDMHLLSKLSARAQPPRRSREVEAAGDRSLAGCKAWVEGPPLHTGENALGVHRSG